MRAPRRPAGDPHRVETGTAHTDTLGGGQGLASRGDGSLLYRGAAAIPLGLRLKCRIAAETANVADDSVSTPGADSATSAMFAVTTPTS